MLYIYSGGRIMSRSADIVFNAIPNTIEEFMALPQAALSNPFDTAALTVVALSVYPVNRDLSTQMLQYLRGPRPMMPMDLQFIRDRFMDHDYVPRSYFLGTSPANDYTPQMPYTIRVFDGPYSYNTQGMAQLFLQSSGADSPRPIELRLAKDGKWYLWEQYLLSGIRAPESTNPWA